MAETGKRIKSLLNDDVRPVVAQIAECLADWYKHAQTIYVKVGVIFKNYIVLSIINMFVHRLSIWKRTVRVAIILYLGLEIIYFKLRKNYGMMKERYR